MVCSTSFLTSSHFYRCPLSSCSLDVVHGRAPNLVASVLVFAGEGDGGRGQGGALAGLRHDRRLGALGHEARLARRRRARQCRAGDTRLRRDARHRRRLGFRLSLGLGLSLRLGLDGRDGLGLLVNVALGHCSRHRHCRGRETRAARPNS